MLTAVYAQNIVKFTRYIGPTTFGDYTEGWDIIYDQVDNAFVLTGIHMSPVTGALGPHALVAKLDTLGQPIWIKGLGYSTGGEAGYSIIRTSDNHYLIAGSTSLAGTDSGNAMVFKVDLIGNIAWAVHLGTSNPSSQEIAYAVIEHSSGIYVVAGGDSVNGSRNWDGLVFALDQNGNLLWQASIGGADNDYFYSLVETSNGNIIAVGSTASYGQGESDVYVAELDPSGNLINTWTYGESAFLFSITEEGYDIAPVPGGGYIITGHMLDPINIASANDLLLMRLDNNMNLQWVKTYNSVSTDWGRAVKVFNNTIYVSGWTSNLGGAQANGLLAAFDLNGNLLWDVSYVGPGHGYFWDFDIVPTGFVITGNRWDLQAFTAYVVKTDFSGMVASAFDTCDLKDVSLTVTNRSYNTSNGGTVTQPLTINPLTLSEITIQSYDSVCVFIENCNGVIDSVKTDPALCAGDTSGYAYYWISNGNPPFTHYLSNGQVFTRDTVGPLPPGTYIDSIVDVNGCVLIDTFTILAPDTVKIQLDSLFPPTACGTTDGWIKITVTGGTAPYTISWSNGMTGDSIFGLGQGTYIVTVTDSNGCFATDTFVLNPQNGLSVSVTYSDPLCYGDSIGWIKVIVSNGTPPYTHVWSNGMTGDSIFNLPAGTYIDSIYDATGCWIIDTITLVDPPQLVLSVVDSALPSTCGGSDGWIKVQATGGTPPITYTWSNGMTGDSIFGLSSGTYVVTATDSNGCSLSDTINLVDPNAPQILGTEVQQPICNGDSSGWIYVQVSGGTPPYTHNWSNGISTNSDTLYNVPAGTYTDTVVDAAGCIAIITVAVPEPDPIHIYLNTTDPSSCTTPDGQVVATVSGGVPPYIIAWNTGTIGDTLKDVGPGTYTVYVKDSLGCIDSATAVLTSPDAPTITLSEELISCAPPAYEVSVNVTGGKPPYIVYWGTYDTTILLTDTLPPDTYIVILQDLTGCLAYDTLYLPMPDTVWATAYPSVDTIAPGDTVQLIGQTNGGIWWWSPGEFLNDSLSLNPIAQPIITTMFYFHSSNAQGCYSIDSVLIVVEGDPIVYFPDYFSPNGDGVNDLFRPIYWGDVKIIWRVYNRWSEIVFEGTESEAWDGTYNGRPQQMDSYVLVAFITPRQGTQKGQTSKIVKNILLIR